MPRYASGYPSIIATRGLVSIYAQLRNIPPKEDVGDKRYIDLLSAALRKDEVITGVSKNFISKLIGFPPENSPEKTDSIDIGKLEQIAKIVIEEKNLLEYLNHGKVEHFWSFFKDRIFTTPEHLSHIQARNYYKFLSDADKESVDGFVDRMLQQYGSDGDDAVVTYNVLRWSLIDRQVRAPILQINMEKRYAVHFLFTRINDDLTEKTVMRTDLPGGSFKLVNSTLYITLTSEDLNKPMMAHFEVAIGEQGFTRLKYLKALVSFSAFNATRPTACIAVLQKADNFQKAFRVAEKTDDIDDDVKFDLLNKRIEVLDESLTINKLKSRQIFEVLDRAAGNYILGYIAQTDLLQRKGCLILSACEIRRDGMVKITIKRLGVFDAFVDNTLYINDDVLCIRHFVETAQDKFKVNYNLKAVPDPITREIAGFKGSHGGFFGSEPVAGWLALYRLTDSEAIEGWQNHYADVIQPDNMPKEKDQETKENKHIFFILRQLGILR